ncbi:hypothetical protein Pmani_028801 [Petrolisthes manimaculis]|uniref:Uncharacterized protein n=1 Tax=Petrolisthes manimaculis TaxID=1843537 RepID=A0AAE1NYU7_9EUCA|nr:hypothetical protein Pmani_028801 [Petrolisthes manimaculis]
MTKKRQNRTHIVPLVLNALFLRMRETELEEAGEKYEMHLVEDEQDRISLSHDRKQAREKILTDEVRMSKRAKRSQEEKGPPELLGDTSNTHNIVTRRDASRIQKREEEASDIQRVRKRRGPEMDEILGCVVELVR